MDTVENTATAAPVVAEAAPKPQALRGKKPIYPWRTTDVNGSFEITVGTEEELTKKRGSLAHCAYNQKRHGRTFKLETFRRGAEGAPDAVIGIRVIRVS